MTNRLTTNTENGTAGIPALTLPADTPPAPAIGEGRAALTPVHVRQPEPLLIDQAGLAQLLALSGRTIKRMVAAGVIPGTVRPFGRTVRFELAAVRSWIARGCPQPKATKPKKR